MKRKIRISLERVRVPGHKKRLTYYKIDWGDHNYMWLEPRVYYKLKAAIEHFDEFLERIMPNRHKSEERESIRKDEQTEVPF